MLPKSWKKPFINEIVIAAKIRESDECKGNKLCATCDNQINENKQFEGNIYLLERKAPYQIS